MVINQIRGISQDERLLAEVLRQAEQSVLAGREGLATERRQCESELGRCEAEIRRLSTGQTKREAVDRLAELQERVRVVEGRLRELRTDANLPHFDTAAVAALFADFDAVWGELIPRERADLVRLLVTSVEYDGANSTVAVSFHDGGIASSNGKRSRA